MVNPYLEPGMKKYWVPSSVDSALFGTEIADYWFPVSQGGDIAFLDRRAEDSVREQLD